MEERMFGIAEARRDRRRLPDQTIARQACQTGRAGGVICQFELAQGEIGQLGWLKPAVLPFITLSADFD